MPYCSYEDKIIELVKKVRTSTGKEKALYQDQLNKLAQAINNDLKKRLESKLSNELERYLDELKQTEEKIKRTVSKSLSGTLKERIKEIVQNKIRKAISLVSRFRKELSCVRLIINPSISSKYSSYFNKIEAFVKSIVQNLRKADINVNYAKLEHTLVNFEIELIREDIKYRIIDDIVNEDDDVS